MNFLMTFVVGQSFLSMMCTMKFGIFLFFAGMVCLMSAFVAVVLPETQGIPLVCSLLHVKSLVSEDTSACCHPSKASCGFHVVAVVFENPPCMSTRQQHHKRMCQERSSSLRYSPPRTPLPNLRTGASARREDLQR